MTDPVQGSSDSSESWHTSDTFQAEIYSGDEGRFRQAFKRFADARYDTLFYHIRGKVTGVPDLDIAAICNGVLTELYRDIWKKGWRHPAGLKFRSCVHQLARDAICEARRKLSRRLEVELDESSLEIPCEDFTATFMLSEVLAKIEEKVRRDVNPTHWETYLEWKQREGLVVGGKTLPPDDEPQEEDQPLSANQRKVLSRVRAAIRTELEAVAQREGWDVEELL